MAATHAAAHAHTRPHMQRPHRQQHAHACASRHACNCEDHADQAPLISSSSRAVHQDTHEGTISMRCVRRLQHASWLLQSDQPRCTNHAHLRAQPGAFWSNASKSSCYAQHRHTLRGSAPCNSDSDALL
eukprot:149165-Chlamydomonas_euryale.AAC.2